MEEEPPLRERERNDDGLLLHLLDMRIRIIMQLKHTLKKEKSVRKEIKEHKKVF